MPVRKIAQLTAATSNITTPRKTHTAATL